MDLVAEQLALHLSQLEEVDGILVRLPLRTSRRNRHARIVFHSTLTVREEILRHDLVPAARLVQAPFGIAEEFLHVPPRGESAPPYLLHVGSCIPRKNIEFLLEIFGAARARCPNLE